MSLINDALKRAREAQEQSPPPAICPQLRPVDPMRAARRGVGLLFAIALAIVAMLLLFLVWQWPQRANSVRALESKPEAQAAPRISAASPAPVKPEKAVLASASGTSEANPPTQPGAVAAARAPKQAVPATAIAPNNPASPRPGAETSEVASAQAGGSTNTAATGAEPPPPKPAPLKLQCIVWNPTRPSAIISGRTLFVGDKVGDFRVAAIDNESATLVGGGRTNVLSLPQ